MCLRRKCWIILIIFLIAFAYGCSDESSNSGDITSSSPSTEEGNDISKEKEEIIDDAMDVAKKAAVRIKAIENVEDAKVYINHESVLVALKLNDSSEEVDDELRGRIEDAVHECYDKAKTIAVSSDREAYESVSRLVKAFEEESNSKMFFEDIKEIVDKVFKKDGAASR